jgi:multimeric flavodoxin WrbA
MFGLHAIQGGIKLAKNILIINGATRKNGNTDIIINKIIEGSINEKIKINLIKLRHKKISDCIGCYTCYKKTKCSINDDMKEILGSINRSDIIIFASPIYWWGVTGIMKIFIDRLYFYYSLPNKNLISGKKAIVVAPMNMTQDNYKTKIFIEFYNILFDNLDLVKINIFLFDNISEKGEVLNNPDYIEQAYTIGKNL